MALVCLLKLTRRTRKRLGGIAGIYRLGRAYHRLLSVRVSDTREGDSHTVEVTRKCDIVADQRLDRWPERCSGGKSAVLADATEKIDALSAHLSKDKSQLKCFTSSGPQILTVG